MILRKSAVCLLSTAAFVMVRGTRGLESWLSAQPCTSSGNTGRRLLSAMIEMATGAAGATGAPLVEFGALFVTGVVGCGGVIESGTTGNAGLG